MKFTSSSIFTVKTLEMVLKTTKSESLLFSIDTPFIKSEVGWKFLQDIAESGLLCAEELNMFAFDNAKELAGVGRLTDLSNGSRLDCNCDDST